MQPVSPIWLPRLPDTPGTRSASWLPWRANQPWLDSALKKLDAVINQISQAGIPPEQTFLLGFSQGACLALEYAARNARHWGSVVGLSGGLIGPQIDLERYPGSLAGTPVFLGCSDIDPHIPMQRVLETAQTMEQLDAVVDARLYPGMGHTVNEDELVAVRNLIQRLHE